MPLLFSYGSLQKESVQLSTFGRRLCGQSDALVGFEPSAVAIEHPSMRAALGMAEHANVRLSANSDSRVAGTVFEVSDAELADADEYEMRFRYERMVGLLASGRQAWVYRHATEGRDG